MSDPRGVSPGTRAAAPEKPTVNMKCRRDGCDSITATDITVAIPGVRARRYQCTKCRHAWVVDVGGTFDI